jgi:hypothetical protein
VTRHTEPWHTAFSDIVNGAHVSGADDLVEVIDDAVAKIDSFRRTECGGAVGPLIDGTERLGVARVVPPTGRPRRVVPRAMLAARQPAAWDATGPGR